MIKSYVHSKNYILLVVFLLSAHDSFCSTWGVIKFRAQVALQGPNCQRDNEPIIFDAIKKGNIDRITFLIAHGADLHVTNMYGQKPLDFALATKWPDVYNQTYNNAHIPLLSVNAPSSCPILQNVLDNVNARSETPEDAQRSRVQMTDKFYKTYGYNYMKKYSGQQLYREMATDKQGHEWETPYDLLNLEVQRSFGRIFKCTLLEEEQTRLAVELAQEQRRLQTQAMEEEQSELCILK